METSELCLHTKKKNNIHPPHKTEKIPCRSHATQTLRRTSSDGVRVGSDGGPGEASLDLGSAVFLRSAPLRLFGSACCAFLATHISRLRSEKIDRAILLPLPPPPPPPSSSPTAPQSPRQPPAPLSGRTRSVRRLGVRQPT